MYLFRKSAVGGNTNTHTPKPTIFCLSDQNKFNFCLFIWGIFIDLPSAKQSVVNSGCDVILEGGDKCFDRQDVQDAVGTLWKDSLDFLDVTV